MNYPRFRFSKYLDYFRMRSIVKFDPLVPLIAQLAEKHIYKWKFLQISLQYYVSLPITIYTCKREFLIISIYRHVFLPLVP